MPGTNCSIFGCGTSRCNTGIGIFRLPSGKDKKSQQTRDEWIKVITRNCVVDANFHRILEAGNVDLCEKHLKKTNAV